MTRLNRNLTALLTTIALAAIPATDAFATNTVKAIVHPRHPHHTSVRYVLGNNWNTTDHRSNGRRTTLNNLDYIVARSI